MRLSPTQRWEVRLLLEQGYQPLDLDLTAIAALTTTAYGRAFLTYADEATFKAAVNLEAGIDFLTPAAIAAAYQPLDADLTAIAALATAAYGRAFLTYADEAAFKAATNLEAGTDFLTPAAIAALYRSSVSADKGDAGATLTAGTSERTSIWATPLTADRAVTLSGTTNGDRFRVVRTAASTGSAVLNVGAGPLRVMGPAEWCDVEYTGAAWMLTAAGALGDILLLG